MTDADQPPPTPRAWHVPPALLTRFADDSGAVKTRMMRARIQLRGALA